MAKLIQTREEKLMKQNYFNSREELKLVCDDFLAIEKNPSKHLLWKYGLGEAVADKKSREAEFNNWLEKFFPNSLK